MRKRIVRPVANQHARFDVFRIRGRRGIEPAVETHRAIDISAGTIDAMMI